MADEALLAAAKAGDLAAAQQAREQGASLSAKNAKGFFPLFWASREGHTEVAEYLLAEGEKEGVGVDDVQDPDNWTALIIAAQEGRVGCAELLLGAGADILHESTSGATPLSMAAQKGQRAVLELFFARLPQGAATVDQTCTVGQASSARFSVTGAGKVCCDC